MIAARGRPGWNNWKLGDSIIVCSVLASLNDDIVLNVTNPNDPGIILIKKLSDEIYFDKYKLIVKQDNKGMLIYPDQYYLEHNLSVIKYNSVLSKKDYVVTQLESKQRSRSINPQIIDKFSKNKQTIDLSNAHTDKSLVEVFDIVFQSQKCIVALSGMTLVAMSCGVPCIGLLNKSWRGAGWNYALEILYRDKNMEIIDV